MTSHPLSVAPLKNLRVLRRDARVVAAGALLSVVADSAAQSAPDTGPRSGFVQVFSRLDPIGMTLIIGAAVVVILLVIRIGIMVRGERRPVAVPPVKRRVAAARDDDPLDRPSMSNPTDWGFDQNKRSAQSREATTGGGSMTMDAATTQWSTSEVHNAAAISRQANDSMGKPTDVAASPYRTAFNPYFRSDAPENAVEVVEVADTLLQAELLVQLGDPKQAMTLLSNHIRQTEKPGPAVWLMLLNLYLTTGRKSQYEALAAGFGTLFNAAVPPWAATKESAARDIETYPQVMMKLHTNWAKPGMRPILDGLLNDDRGGSRQGFSLKAYRDLLFLVEIVGELEKMSVEEGERDEIQRKLGRIA